MDDQLFGEGFRVTINRCTHRVILEVHSYASARLAVNPAGAITFECNDVTQLYGAIIPTKLAAQVLGSILGFAALPDDIHEDETDTKHEQVLMFSDDLSLELWLRQEFFPNLDVFDDPELDEEHISGLVTEMTRQVMAEVLGNKAKESVLRHWGA